MIIFAFDFARARRARRAGNRINKIRRLAKRVAEGGLAGAGWSGDDEQNSVTRELLTQGFGFVRGFFPTPPLQATTCCEMAASFDFRAERIQFAENFLSDEFERAADRFVLAQMMRELREMAFQPGQFFRDIGAIGEERDFLEQALVIDRRSAVRPFRFVRAGRRGNFSPPRMERANFFELLAQRLEPMNQIFGEMLSFALAHFDQIRQRRRSRRARRRARPRSARCFLRATASRPAPAESCRW